MVLAHEEKGLSLVLLTADPWCRAYPVGMAEMTLWAGEQM